MTEASFYTDLLHLGTDWVVERISIDHDEPSVDVYLRYLPSTAPCPPSGQKDCPIYDLAAERSWRHLDTMQYHHLTNHFPLH